MPSAVEFWVLWKTGYQRGKIQEESMYYEQLKHDGSLPIIGVNTFRNPQAEEEKNINPAGAFERAGKTKPN